MATKATYEIQVFKTFKKVWEPSANTGNQNPPNKRTAVRQAKYSTKTNALPYRVVERKDVVVFQTKPIRKK